VCRVLINFFATELKKVKISYSQPAAAF